MQQRSLQILLALLLILLPFGAIALYRQATALPRHVVFATGPAGGRYRALMESLGAELQERYPIKVTYYHTMGSLENLKLLEDGKVDFALFQAGSHRGVEASSDTISAALQRDADQVAFVSNAYLEIMHLLVREDTEIQAASDMRGKRVAIGMKNSGDHIASQILLRHLNIPLDEIQSRALDYKETQQHFEDGTLDVALMQTGLQAPVVHHLIKNRTCRLLEVPHPDAFVAKDLRFSRFTIPSGMYQVTPQPLPPSPIETMAVRAQLLTRSRAQTGLVECVAKTLHSQSFIQENELQELLAGGYSFAKERPDFAVHSGANNLFRPELRPLINPDFMEATEGLRSFVMSVLIAVVLLVRWWRKHRIRKQEHKLDRYIHKLLQIEREQMDLDEDETRDDMKVLQQYLDEVTKLRQEALNEFSAHQLSEDRAVDCFLEMSHALSSKISAKLDRQILRRLLRERS